MSLKRVISVVRNILSGVCGAQFYLIKVPSGSKANANFALAGLYLLLHQFAGLESNGEF